MPGRDEEMKSPEEIQEMMGNGDQSGKAVDSTPLSEIKQKLHNLQSQAENEMRKEIRRGFEGEIEGHQKIIRTLKDIEGNGFEGTLEELHHLRDGAGAVHTLAPHQKNLDSLFSLINEACCMAQNAIADPGKMADLRSYCANVLPLKALGQMPAEAKEPSSPAAKLRTIARWFDAEQGSSKHPTWEGDDVQMFLLDLATLLDRKEESDV